MFYGDNVQGTREVFRLSWQKYRAKQALSALEQQLVNVIIDHPEYHAMLESKASSDQWHIAGNGQNNPFLHMGLHLVIRDQIAVDKPLGIAEVYRMLLEKHASPVLVEHIMMEYLAEYLWQLQGYNHADPHVQTTVDHEINYLISLKHLVQMS